MKFTKGTSGNPAGRKRGSRNRATQLRAQLETDVPDILKTIIASAKAGDMAAARMILDRVLPPLRAVDLPQTIEATGETLASLAESIVRASMRGEIPADTARELASALSAVARVKVIDDLETRLARLEQHHEETNRQT
ncbi:MAG: hypothetical protein IH623_26715 [Verrucomicrobia bacterium]|nr:hypothetical protein [Verrucomicrobiota bacterium]